MDNDCTPHLLVDAEYPQVRVPAGYAQDGQIVLNVSPGAVRQLHMDNEGISFESRFGGVAHGIYLPIASVLAIYARENGQGMVFELEAPDVEAAEDEDDLPPPETPRPGGRPSLKVVK